MGKPVIKGRYLVNVGGVAVGAGNLTGIRKQIKTNASGSVTMVNVTDRTKPMKSNGLGNLYSGAAGLVLELIQADQEEGVR